MVDLTEAQIEEAIGPLSTYAHDCHNASRELVKSGLLPKEARVARGWAIGIAHQHSWVVIGRDVYDPENEVVDITAWSYRPSLARVIIGKYGEGMWTAHGDHSIFETFGKPTHTGGETIVLPTLDRLSFAAQEFLRMLGPLDWRGWNALFNGGMRDWPAAEIIDACCDVKELKALIPIDIVGMLTDRNPAGYE